MWRRRSVPTFITEIFLWIPAEIPKKSNSVLILTKKYFTEFLNVFLRGYIEHMLNEVFRDSDSVSGLPLVTFSKKKSRTIYEECRTRIPKGISTITLNKNVWKRLWQNTYE